MNPINEIRSLLDKGQYMKAASLVDENKITDCLSICQKLEDIAEIGELIERSISFVSSKIDWINGREAEIRNIRDAVKDALSQVEGEERVVQVKSKNQMETSELIDEMFSSLKLPDHVKVSLTRWKIQPESCIEIPEESSIENMRKALDLLEKTLEYEPDINLQSMRCVRKQKTDAHNIKLEYCERFLQHFTTYVRHLFAKFSESFINHVYSQTTLGGHEIIFDRLFYLRPIVEWMYKNDEDTYQQLCDVYVDGARLQYSKEIRSFFDCIKEEMASPMRHHVRLNELSSDTRKRSSMNAGDSSTRSSSLSGGAGATDIQSDAISGKSSEASFASWDDFDTYIDRRILDAIHPTCVSEYDFFSRFFQMEDSGKEITNHRVVDIFSFLEAEFIDFANFYNSQNGLYSLYIFVRLSHYLDQSSLSFLSKIYSRVLIEVKRNFDSFMQQQELAIRDLKAPKTSKCGVLSAVKNFEQFVVQVELLMKSTRLRRPVIDKWYDKLGTELFCTIDRVEHGRTPKEMIRLENYNYLHDVLSRYRSIKVPELEELRKKADSQYKEARKAYVACYFGRPLEKINKFFEGVEAKLKLGVKEEEISFQLAFNKTELRKVLQQVTLKEVRKGLEQMYRGIEKHAYEPDSNLIQVIWRDMQDEFLSQYKAKQGMIERCYPSSNLSLAFTIDDVIDVFKHIAQSH